MQKQESSAPATATAFGILIALSVSHMLNDTMQSVISAVYPLIKDTLALSFSQIGLIALSYQISASVFQPLFGFYLDKRPNPWFLPLGMVFTMGGLIVLAAAHTFETALIAVFLSGIGSSVFHPEASRLTSMASGGRRGMAQSVFQVGGSTGFSFGPLLAAIVISPYGQGNIAYFSLLAFVALVALVPVCRWYSKKLAAAKKADKPQPVKHSLLPRRKIIFTMAILLILIFTKYVYISSISSYYTFYLIHKFGVSIQESQIFLFVFLFASAMGTLAGGPLGDRFGRRYVIWFSILGAAPFALMLPHASLVWTCTLSIAIAFIISSAFPAILVYAQELLPFKLGLVSGLFFGLAFGIAGISSAVLGKLADMWGIEYVYGLCAFAPLMGMIAYFLPTVRTLQASSKTTYVK